MLSEELLSPDTEPEEEDMEETGGDAQGEQAAGRVLPAKRKKGAAEDEEDDGDPTPSSGKSATKAAKTTKSSATNVGKGGKGGEAPEGDQPVTAEEDKLNPDLGVKLSAVPEFYAKGGKKKVYFHQLVWDLHREYGQPRTLKQTIWMDYYRELLAGTVPNAPYNQCLGWILNCML